MGGLRFPALDLGALYGTEKTYDSSAITWTEVTPSDSSVTVEVALDGESFTSISNGGAIPGLSSSDPLAGVVVTIKVTLTASTGGADTPTFSGLNVAITTEQAALRGADDWYNEGNLRFLTGANAGIAIEVKSWDASMRTLVLKVPPPFDMAAGDTFEIFPGCDKFVTTCSGKFNNINNFRGEPHVPGTDLLLRFPDAQLG